LAKKLGKTCSPKELNYKKPKFQIWTIDFIKTYGLEALERELSISFVRHEKYPNLVLLLRPNKFTPVSPIVKECVRLILDEENDWKIIARGYSMFFSHDDWKKVAKVNWKKSRVYEKPDGMLAILYFYRGEWHVSSKFSPDGNEEIITMKSNIFITQEDQFITRGGFLVMM